MLPYTLLELKELELSLILSITKLTLQLYQIIKVKFDIQKYSKRHNKHKLFPTFYKRYFHCMSNIQYCRVCHLDLKKFRLSLRLRWSTQKFKKCQDIDNEGVFIAVFSHCFLYYKFLVQVKVISGRLKFYT